ncbi:uncharacterized protein LOC132792927 isoform X2 [Drosophila nasuta]|uniref:uncharacterized protein LOC132792927 isoform X2 n=1 Tax=Drosophila nasuta TaxID=42062 RepID=UPI00295EEABB|nr:uncharacterized protein LOC132792927 isoform X2 [Drosophila nasuta]
MDNFGIPTEINVGVMKAIAELQYTDSDCGFVNEKKINDHVVYYKHDKDSLVRQSLDNLTFLGILVRTGSSAFALRQNLQFASGANAIPWITPQKQDGRAAKMKQNSTAKKKSFSPAEIDSLFSYYFEQYKNMKTITNREHFEVNSKTIVLEDTNKLPLNIVLKNQKSKPMEEVSKNVESKLKNTNRKGKRNIEAKTKRCSPAEIDSLFSRYFEEYRSMKINNNPVNSEVNTGPEDITNMLPFNALLEDQKSKPMEEVLENVESKLKITNRKNKRNIEAKKKIYSPRRNRFVVYQLL